MKRFLLILPLLVIALASCEKDKVGEVLPDVPDLDEHVLQNYPHAILTPTGVYIVVTEQGTGAKPVNGERLFVYYRGTLLTGEVFDSVPRSIIQGVPTPPFRFFFNSSSVIKGWNRGFAELNKGSKAIFFIPDSLAYGSSRRGIIPPHSPLRFDVELLYVK